MSSGNNNASATSPSGRGLAEVAAVFLRLGLTAYGGPAAHVAIMEDEFVRRRKWLSHERFLDLLGAVNLIPGPSSTELAIYVGYLRAGWWGLLLGGVCFILPAMLIVAGLAWGYMAYGSLPQIAGVLRGVKPVVIAIIVRALVSLGPKVVKTPWLGLMALAALAASLLGLDPLSLVLVCGAVVALGRAFANGTESSRGATAALLLAVCAILALIHLPHPFLAALLPVASDPAVVAGEVPPWQIFAYFLKIGAVLYGGGYVLLAFLQGDLVPRWLTAQQLLDATAVGQVTPGPLFTTATFIGFVLGYQSGGPLGGWLGATAGTVGIFLPSFVFIALGGTLFPRLRNSRLAGAFLDGVNVAAVALIAAAAWGLGREALVDAPTVVIAVVSGLLLFRFRINSAWLILAGALVGLLLPPGTLPR
jgi:chromate transporter